MLARPRHPSADPVPLAVRENPIVGPYVHKLSAFEVEDFAVVNAKINEGIARCRIAKTGMNKNSSRSYDDVILWLDFHFPPV